MNSEEFQQLVDYIRDALAAPIIGLTIQEMHAQDQRIDSDAYKAAKAVEQFFEAKRSGEL